VKLDDNTLHCQEGPGFIILAKPHGIATHSPGDGVDGLVEILSRARGTKFYAVHRLDKETSGALIFATSPHDAAVLTKLFEGHAVSKKYAFVTDKKRSTEPFTHASYIKKYRGRVVSWPKHTEMNAETSFSFLHNHGEYALWRAEPRTGKPHQIRLHAKDCGIPILGDAQHGGSKFHRLMLHAEAISFPWNGSIISYVAPLPDSFAKDLNRVNKTTL
jgi:23S rRNA (cytosine1962-C5)-methyltransferase